jgi:hypothetical protein
LNAAVLLQDEEAVLQQEEADPVPEDYGKRIGNIGVGVHEDDDGVGIDEDDDSVGVAVAVGDTRAAGDEASRGFDLNVGQEEDDGPAQGVDEANGLVEEEEADVPGEN